MSTLEMFRELCLEPGPRNQVPRTTTRGHHISILFRCDWRNFGCWKSMRLGTLTGRPISRSTRNDKLAHRFAGYRPVLKLYFWVHYCQHLRVKRGIDISPERQATLVIFCRHNLGPLAHRTRSILSLSRSTRSANLLQHVPPLMVLLKRGRGA